MMFKLTAFADEVSPDLSEQVSALKAHSISGVDVRSIGGINVLDLTLDDLEHARDVFAENGIHVHCVGSPVNKVPYDVMARATELEKLKKACYAAARLNTKKIRLFTPEVPEAQHEEMTATVIDWMSEQKRVAIHHGLVLIHENDWKFWGAYPQNAKRMFEMLGDENFRAVFDFSNSVLIGYDPLIDWLPWMVPYLDSVHIKDSIRETGKVVPAGEGEGRISETLAELIRMGWNGPLTLEPHLQGAGPLGGFSGAQLFEVAVNALRRELTKAGGQG